MQARIVVPSFTDWIDVEELVYDLLSQFADSRIPKNTVKRILVSISSIALNKKVWVELMGAKNDNHLNLCLARRETAIPDGMCANHFQHLIANKLGQVLYLNWRKIDYFEFVPRK